VSGEDMSRHVRRQQHYYCSRPTVLGHAKCLRYWQPAKVHTPQNYRSYIASFELTHCQNLLLHLLCD